MLSHVTKVVFFPSEPFNGSFASMLERSEALKKHNSDIGYLERTEDGHLVPKPKILLFSRLTDNSATEISRSGLLDFITRSGTTVKDQRLITPKEH